MLAYFFTSLVRASAIVFCGILAVVAQGLTFEFLPINVHLGIGFISILAYMYLSQPFWRTLVDPQDVSIMDLIHFVCWFIKVPALLIVLWPLGWAMYLLGPEFMPRTRRFNGVEVLPPADFPPLLSRKSRLRAFSGLCLLMVLLTVFLPNPGKPLSAGPTPSAIQKTREPLKALPAEAPDPRPPHRLHR